ncbi:hypothetical protein CHLNCDRAFT_144213 [Chlorella variabilis]|uniref:F-box domain-containing protein n=1 Tax=Chlorella variabilis TaxID=554065 RepID=E1ZC63_CHLVA|nr:hypothetical protein CHLNCDRAFT_144213 [Chlorella variabilis]EFN56755.1 hypothetical protein CHLNCDRAFT_144213 [Chlorella variabilis]|eukprot:XP_005848857.1 hypothetical protein CHLNCDRAFT_144213 [Chlorella variabilis]
MAAAASGAPAAAPPPPPAPPPPSDEGPPSILSLPAEVAQQVFASLSAADLAACMATCRAWREAAACPPLWQSLAARRWQHGGTVGQLGALRRDGRWLELYRQRRQLDARALSLLSALQWPNRQRATLEQLLQLHYPDVRDVLLGLAGADCIPTAAANKDWPDVAAAAAAAPCLAPYWALQAQEELHVRHCAQRLRRQAAMVEAAAAVLARRAEQAGEPAAGPAGEQPTGAAAPAGQQPPGAAAAAGSAATGGDAAAEAAAMLRQEWDRGESAAAGQSHASAWAGVMHGKADEQLRMLVALAFEEGALALSAVHQHFAELAWVRQALDALGVELRHRMEAEGVRGGLPALRLLSQLLFGPGPPPRHYHFASIPPPDGHGMEITASAGPASTPLCLFRAASPFCRCCHGYTRCWC